MSKEKYSIEFVFKSSSNLLFNFISTPSGLSEWFADNVNSRGEDFSFIWDGSEENAKRLKSKTNKYIRFQWEEDEDTDYYFDLSIIVDDLTKDVSLIVTDFAEEDELEESKLLWTNQIDSLKKVLGSS